MRYIDFKSLLYSDTPVPDIFINEYLPALKSDYVKIYIYCLFLVGKNRSPSIEDLASVLDMPLQTVKDGLQTMDNLNILSWAEDGVVLKDLKEIEINRFYRPKTTSTPEEASGRSRLNARRRQAIEAINNKFYSGVMSATWYGDIDMWFDQYGFDEDVMLLLFQHCRDRGALTKQYVSKVAENMFLKGVKNSFDFDRYIQEYEFMKSVSRLIRQKLNIRKPLTVMQEEHIDKWLYKYGLSVDVIDIALQEAGMTTSDFRYLNNIVERFNESGLNTVEKAQADLERYKTQVAAGNKASGSQWSSFRGNFDQREYSEKDLDKFISSDFGGGAVTETGTSGGKKTDNNDNTDGDPNK